MRPDTAAAGVGDASAVGSDSLDAYNSAIQRVLTGQQSPKAALDQAQKEAQAAIDANK